MNSQTEVSFSSEWSAMLVNGDYATFLHETEPFAAQAAEVALARAFVFAGHGGEAEARAVRNRWAAECASLMQKAWLSLLDARLALLNKEYLPARDHAMAASRWFEQPLCPALFLNARLILSLAEFESGRPFEAMRIGAETYDACPKGSYLRSIAAAQLSLRFFDLGRLDWIERLLPEMPESRRSRVEMMLARLNGSVRQDLDFLSATCPRTDASWETEQTILEALAGVRLLGNEEECRMAEASPGFSMARILATKPRSSGIASMVLALYDTSTAVPSLPPQPYWRDALELAVLKAMLAARTSKKEAFAIWRNEVNPILSSHWLSIPTIPHLPMAPHDPQNAFARRMQELVVDETATSREVPPSEEVFRIHGTCLSGVHQDKALCLDLEKSWISLRVLQVFAASREQTLTKERLHEQLTRSRYSPELHDPRLRKLLSRLEKRLAAAGFPRIWFMPGNNTIILRHRILQGGDAPPVGS